MKAGWEKKTIGDVCEVVNGGTPKTGIAEYWEGPHQWITPAEMGKRATPYIDQTERSITGAGLQNSSARLLPSQSVILSSRAPIGHLVINTTPMATNQGCKGLVPKNGLNSKYLYYYLAGIVPLLNALGTGATFKELSGGKLKEVPIPVAPLPEQHRIVSILDEAFDGVATAKANAEKNLQNARVLLSVATRQAFDLLSESHEARLLGSVCRFENGDRGKNYPGKEHRVGNGIPFINAGHLTPTGIDFSAMDYITPERFNLLGNGKILPRDILFCLRGSLGKFACVGDLSCGAIASSLVIIRPTNELDHDYLMCFLSSTLCSEQIDAYKGGAAQPNLGAKDLKLFALPLPPIEMQRLVSNRLIDLQEKTAELVNVTEKNSPHSTNSENPCCTKRLADSCKVSKD